MNDKTLFRGAAPKVTDQLFERLEKFESSLHSLWKAGALDDQHFDSPEARKAKRAARALFSDRDRNGQ